MLLKDELDNIMTLIWPILFGGSPKFNMEPENQPQEEEIAFGNNHS